MWHRLAQAAEFETKDLEESCEPPAFVRNRKKEAAALVSLRAAFALAAESHFRFLGPTPRIEPRWEALVGGYGPCDFARMSGQRSARSGGYSTAPNPMATD